MIADMMTFLAVLAVSYCGVLCGGALALIAPAELKTGGVYFQALRLLAGVGALVIYAIYAPNILVPTVAILGALYLLVGKAHLRDAVSFAVLGILVAVASKDSQWLLLESVFIFLYGLPTGTVIAGPFAKKGVRAVAAQVVGRSFMYLVVALAIALIF
jgi:hypothetical protein